MVGVGILVLEVPIISENTSNNELFLRLFDEGALVLSSVVKISAEAIDSCFLISSCNMSFALAFAILLPKKHCLNLGFVRVATDNSQLSSIPANLDFRL